MDKGAQGPIQNGLFSGWMIWVQTLPSNLFAGRNKCILTSNAVVQDASTTATSNKQQATSNKTCIQAHQWSFHERAIATVAVAKRYNLFKLRTNVIEIGHRQT